MYLQLGDIRFEGLLGFESFSDSIEATYAQHELINRKPHLQRTGDGLREFNAKIKLHAGFCIPEEQYEKLEAKRLSGEIMPLIYGNGKYEGNYILKSISRTPIQTDLSGAYVELDCDITLIEAGGLISPALRREQAKTAAFALTANRPLPVNSDVTAVNNPALEVANNNQAAGQAGDEIAGTLNDADKIIASVPDPLATLIPPAQKFMDMVPSITAKINRSIDDMDEALDLITELGGNNPAINTVAPALQAAVDASKTVLIAGQTLITNLSSLPNPVTDPADAATILNFQKDTVILGQDLIDNLNALNTASAPIIVAVATKQNLKNV